MSIRYGFILRYKMKRAYPPPSICVKQVEKLSRGDSQMDKAEIDVIYI